MPSRSRTRKNHSPRTHTPARMPCMGRIYSNSCPHCVAMHSEWKLLKQQGKNKGFDVVSVEDGTDAGNAALQRLTTTYGTPPQKQGGVPTLFKYDRQGQLTYYNGPRTAQAMSQFVVQGSSSGSMAGGSRKRRRSGRRVARHSQRWRRQ